MTSVHSAGVSSGRSARLKHEIQRAILANVPEQVHRWRMAANRVAMYLRDSRRERTVGRVDPDRFDAVLNEHAADRVFVHVGLRDVKRAFGCDPYEFLLERFDERFESVFNPGFTPSFRFADGLYHKQFSAPRFGTFSRLFMHDCDHRTDDPTNSILIRGPHRFDGCPSNDTWSPEGPFGELDRENVLYLNVGTDWLRSSQIHYIESLYGVPYIETAEYEGTVYYDETDHEQVTHRSHEYVCEKGTRWNRSKLEAGLEADGVLDSYDLEGLRIRAFHARDLREWIEPRLDIDPYYIVT